MAYSWPGNVRELKNTIESMIVIDIDGRLDLDDLTEDLQAVTSSGRGDGPAGVDVLVGKSLEEIEKHYIIETLKRTAGNREEAAKILGIGERTLYRKLKEYRARLSHRRRHDRDAGLSERKITLYNTWVGKPRRSIAMGIIRQLPAGGHQSDRRRRGCRAAGERGQGAARKRDRRPGHADRPVGRARGQRPDPGRRQRAGDDRR